MFEVNEGTEKIDFTFSAEMDHVNRLIEESHIFFHQLNIRTSELSNLNLVLRELVNNAVEHGSRNNPEKTVKCTVRHLGRKRFKIQAEDEGEGVDQQDIDWEIPLDPRQARNRGFALINTFADQVKFNDKGNRITVFISLSKETDFRLERDGEYRVVIPCGDLTAAVEKKFRSLLESLLEEEDANSFRFDFRHVEDIDSVSLSVLIVFSKILAKKKNWKLEIIHLNDELKKLFQLTRVDRIFKVLENTAT